ncbi:MAG: ANTAR domain-containing protein [Bryobacteraceae bacterium]
MAARDIRTASQSQVSIFHQVSSILSSDLSLDEMLGEVIGLAVRATACDACLVYLIDHGSNEIVLRASQVPHAGALGMLRLKIGEGVTGWVAEQRSVVALAENASSDARFKRLQGLVEDTYEAFLSVPIVSGGELIGVVNVHHRVRHDHTREETSTMIFIGEQLGVAISKSLLEEENARLLEETQEMKRELETRKLMERAKGILQQKHGITEEDAYLRLRNQSRRLRRPIRELAEAIILTEELNRQGKGFDSAE